MTQEDAIRKAMACLRLAKSSNQAEAALAASKAQEIIDRFKLDVNALDYDANVVKESNEPIQDFGGDPLEHADNVTRRWSMYLGSAVARANGCSLLYTDLRNKQGFVLTLVGRPSDVSTVRYIYSYLKSEVLRLKVDNTKGNSAVYKDQYCKGVVDTICQRLRAQRQETQAAVKAENANNPLALVRVNSAIARLEKHDQSIAKFIEDKYKKLGKGRSGGGASSPDAMSARAHGQRDGKNVRFTSAKAGLGRGVAGVLS